MLSNAKFLAPGYFELTKNGGKNARQMELDTYRPGINLSIGKVCFSVIVDHV